MSRPAPRRLTLLVPVLLAACAAPPDQPKPAAPAAPTPDALASELLALAASDQEMEFLVINGDPAIREPGFHAAKDRLQAERAARCKEIFAAVGYPGADLVGPEAAEAFWVLVQHADADPAFQEQVLEAMRPIVERGDADPSDYAMLTDRVRINTGRKQLYGSQVRFENETGRVLPKPLADPAEVDARRAAVGLEPLWKYINGMMELHYQMNEQVFREQGIDAPAPLPDGFSAW